MPATPGRQPHRSEAPSGQQVQIQLYTLFLQRPTQQLSPIWSAVLPRRHRRPPRWVAPTTRGTCGGPPWVGAARSPGPAPRKTEIKQDTTALIGTANSKSPSFLIRRTQQKAMWPRRAKHLEAQCFRLATLPFSSLQLLVGWGGKHFIWICFNRCLEVNHGQRRHFTISERTVKLHPF